MQPGSGPSERAHKTSAASPMALIPADASTFLPVMRDVFATDIRKLNQLLLVNKAQETFRVHIETPESCQSLYDTVGRFCEQTHVGRDLEFLIRDAFCFGDYDPAPQADSHAPFDPNEHAMFCATLRDSTGFPAGIAYWREVPEEHMQRWISENAALGMQQLLSRQLSRLASSSSLAFADTPAPALAAATVPTPETESRQAQEQEMFLGRDDGTAAVTAPAAVAVAPAGVVKTPAAPTAAAAAAGAPATAPAAPAASGALVPAEAPLLPLSDVYRRWVKLELIATHPKYYGQGVATLLLTAVLLGAVLRAQERCVLHVSGGPANLPATRLYQKFQFEAIPEGAFHKPNRDMWALTDIPGALRALDVASMLAGGVGEGTALEGGGGSDRSGQGGGKDGRQEGGRPAIEYQGEISPS